jgi:hypothetical protein
MYAVHFFENKNLLLSKLLNQCPSVGEELKIKGRKGKITSVFSIDDNKIHAYVSLETVKKSQTIVDNSKKKKR